MYDKAYSLSLRTNRSLLLLPRNILLWQGLSSKYVYI